MRLKTASGSLSYHAFRVYSGAIEVFPKESSHQNRQWPKPLSQECFFDLGSEGRFLKYRADSQPEAFYSGRPL
jgi:hypothetical protein